MFELIRTGWPLLDKKYRSRVPLILVGFFALSLLEIVGIAAIFPALILYIDPYSEQGISIFQYFTQVFPNSNVEDLSFIFLICLVIIFIMKNIASVFLNRILILFTQNQVKYFSISSFHRYAHMPHLKGQSYDISTLMFIINSIGSILYTTFANNFVILISDIIAIVFIFSLLLIANPFASGVAASIIITSGLIVLRLTSRRLIKIGETNRAAIEETVKQIRNAFSSLRELRVSGTESFFEKRYARSWQNLVHGYVNQQTYTMSTRYFIEIGMIVALTAYVIVSANNSSKAELIAQVGLFGLASLRILPATSRIFSNIQTIMTTRAVIMLVDEERRKFEGVTLEPPGSCNPIDRQHPDTVTVRLENISFYYPETPNASLKNIDFEIPANSSLGIVGASGAGKSTLADLLLGIIPPTQGRIVANGNDVSNDIRYWRSMVAYVPQSIHFVSGTLKENIAFGVEADKIDREAIWASIEASQLSNVVSRLRSGVDTPVGETGQFLSGGERQRVGIARALYRNAKFIVFDEATSALDASTERLVSEATLRLTNQATIVVIAHRLKTIQGCDKILYLDNGEVAGFGTFEELKATCQGFAEMVENSELEKSQNLR